MTVTKNTIAIGLVGLLVTSLWPAHGQQPDLTLGINLSGVVFLQPDGRPINSVALGQPFYVQVDDASPIEPKPAVVDVKIATAAGVNWHGSLYLYLERDNALGNALSG